LEVQVTATAIQAKCILEMGDEMPVASMSTQFFGPLTRFDVTLGTVYLVAGVGVFEDTLLVLVVDDTGKPNWLPPGLFAFDTDIVPSRWKFRILGGRSDSESELERWQVLWGYRELVEEPGHLEGLIERDPTAMRVFRDRVTPAE
jgi:hypothetical protein